MEKMPSSHPFTGTAYTNEQNMQSARRGRLTFRCEFMLVHVQYGSGDRVISFVELQFRLQVGQFDKAQLLAIVSLDGIFVRAKLIFGQELRHGKDLLATFVGGSVPARALEQTRFDSKYTHTRCTADDRSSRTAYRILILFWSFKPSSSFDAV